MTTADPDAQPQVFRADPGWTFPALGRRAVPNGARVDVSAEETLWTLYDTPDADLAHFGGYLARSSAGSWWLGLGALAPGNPGSTRVRTAAVSGRGVPTEFRDLLAGVRAGADLRPRRRVASERVARIVIGADGDVLGEVDEIRHRTVPDAGDPAGPTDLSRLIEVTSVEPGFGAAVARRLVKSQARPVEGVADATHADTVGDALRRFVADRRSEILRGDVRLRLGANAVHPTRVAIRRLRSVLRVSDAVDAERRSALDGELRWFSGVLGAVRDLDVLQPQLADALDRLAGEVEERVVLAVRRAVDAELERQTVRARTQLQRAMRGRRYLALLRELRVWADEPPLTGAADRPARRLTEYAATADRTLARRLERAGRRSADDEAGHRARKAAKRARYVGEFVAEFASSADRKRSAKRRSRAKEAQRLQTALGHKQDAAMAAQWLAALTARPAQLDPGAAFGVGVLWARERRRAG